MNLRFDTITIDFESLFESAPNSYIALSPDQKIIGASDAFLNATGTRRHRLIGKNLYEACPFFNTCVPSDERELILREALVYAQRTKEALSMDTQQVFLPTTSGEDKECYWSFHLIPVLFEQQQLLCIILKIDDVTDFERMRKRANEQQRRNVELEATEKIHLRKLKESEARFLGIFNLSPIPVFMLNAADEKLVLVNSAFEKFFNITSSQAITKSIPDLGFVEKLDMVEFLTQLSVQGRRVTDIELSVKLSDGTARKMLASSELVSVDNMQVYLIAMVDITQRKNHENNLLQSNHFLDTVLENIPNMVFVKDAETLAYLRLNKAGEQLLGKTQAEIIGKLNSEIYPPDIAAIITAKEEELIRKGTASSSEEEPLSTSMGDRWIHTRKIPVSENGKPKYLVGISEDVTEQKKQQDAILQLNKELEAFSYSVSHDLRAPLRAVTGYAQILDEDYGDVLDTEGKRLLHTISDNAEKMGHLIDNLLTFSRLGRKELSKRDTNMNDLTARAIAEVNKNVDHQAEIVVNQLHSIQADPELMTQVVINLVENAVKYSARKEKPLIEISSYMSGNEIVFCFADNGAGFDMRYYDKLFGVFQRLHSVEEFEGTGVGLAIVQRIITRHGGRVWAKGKIDVGATFCFAVPV